MTLEHARAFWVGFAVGITALGVAGLATLGWWACTT